MFEKHTHGIRFEKRKTKQGTKYKCVAFDIINGKNCADVFQGDYSLGGVQILGSKRCAEDYANRWNEFFEMNGLLYLEEAEQYKIAPAKDAVIDVEHDYAVATIYRVPDDTEVKENEKNNNI